MSKEFILTDNNDGTVTKTVDGEEYVYKILVGGNIPERESIVDYCYYQHDNHKENPDDPNETSLVDALKAENVGEWKFCSGTCTAMVLAITYGDKNITPKSVLYWGDESNKDKRIVNWDGSKLKAWEQDEYGEEDKQVYDNRWQGKNGGFAAIDGSDIENNEQYLKNLKTYLAAGQPVIIHVKPSDSDEHYVVAVGVEEGVSLEEATFEQLVIFDPGTNQENKISTIGNAYKEYTIKDYRMITPYLYDFDEKDFVRDEKDGKTTDAYYVDPIKKEDGSIVPSEKGRIIKDIIDLVKKLGLPDMDRAIKNMVKTATGEDISVYKNLNIYENGEYRASNDGADGFNVVTVNVPDRSDEVERYKKLWLMAIGGGEKIETDIPKPGDPENPDNPGGGGNYVFESAVDVGGFEELKEYAKLQMDVKEIDIVEINGGLAIHIGEIYNGNRTDVRLTVTNLKNGMSTSGDSCFYGQLNIRNAGWKYKGIAIHNGMVTAYIESGRTMYTIDTWLNAVDFHAPANWNMHFILV